MSNKLVRLILVLLRQWWLSKNKSCLFLGRYDSMDWNLLTRRYMTYRTGSLEISPTTRLLIFPLEKRTYKVYDFLKQKYGNRNKREHKNTKAEISITTPQISLLTHPSPQGRTPLETLTCETHRYSTIDRKSVVWSNDK